MNIVAFSLIKNEEDIIKLNLDHASNWADKIYVFDNGSSDSTWDIVKSIANDKIIPFKQDFCSYRDTLRSQIFNSVKNELNDGDWMCIKLDSDEFYLDNPRDFLSSLKPYITVVYGLNVEYQFTEKNIKKVDFDPDDFEYAKIQFCEQRFVKFRRNLIWNGNDNLPLHPGPPSKKTIKYAHYQFRTKDQITRRLITRKEAINSGHKAYWENDLNSVWQLKITDKQECIYIPKESKIDIISKNDFVQIPESTLKIWVKIILHFFKIWG
jgi:hypothetical protein